MAGARQKIYAVHPFIQRRLGFLHESVEVFDKGIGEFLGALVGFGTSAVLHHADGVFGREIGRCFAHGLFDGFFLCCSGHVQCPSIFMSVDDRSFSAVAEALNARHAT